MSAAATGSASTTESSRPATKQLSTFPDAMVATDEPFLDREVPQHTYKIIIVVTTAMYSVIERLPVLHPDIVVTHIVQAVKLFTKPAAMQSLIHDGEPLE